MAGSESVPLMGKVAVTAVTMAASLGSTSCIHFLFSPYILSMNLVLPKQTAAASVEVPSPENDTDESRVPEMSSSSILEVS
jgi:hypothetical protein